MRILGWLRLHPLAVMLILAAGFRLGWVLWTPVIPDSDYAAYLSLAQNLLAGQGYSNPAGPTTFWPPGYPFALAGFLYLVNGSLLGARIMNALLSILSVYLVYLLVARAISERAGLAAGWVTALTPSLVMFPGLFATENLALPLFMLGMLLLLSAVQNHRYGLFLLAGLAFGAAALTRPNFLFLAGVLPLYYFFKSLSFKRFVLSEALFGLGLILVIAPWTTRNHYETGQLIPVSSNGGFNLLISFSEESTGQYIFNLDQKMGAAYDWKTNRLVGIDLDEFEIDRKASRMAMEYIREDPLRAAALAPKKLYLLLRDDVSAVYDNLFAGAKFLLNERAYPVFVLLRLGAQGYYMVMLGLMVYGLTRWKQLKESPDALFLGLPLIFLVLFHLVFFGNDRFHMPFLPLLWAFSSVGVLGLVEKFGKGGWEADSNG